MSELTAASPRQEIAPGPGIFQPAVRLTEVPRNTMRSGRMRRVDEAVRAVLSDGIATQLHDPRVGFVTVTGVKTSSDLRHARVYVSVLGDEATREATLAGLRSAHGFLQSLLASELNLKHTPALSFFYDDSIDRGMRITRMLNDLPGDPDGLQQPGRDAGAKQDREEAG